jgi:ABC-2 type transport system ATP-binding protein
LDLFFKGDTAIEFIGSENIDIVPIINYLDYLQFVVNEAKVIKPSLEDVFVEATGIEANMMKKEKEKK